MPAASVWRTGQPTSLVTALVESGWIAEDLETHLLPHLARACQVAKSPWMLQDANWQDNGVSLVTLTWSGLVRLRA